MSPFTDVSNIAITVTAMLGNALMGMVFTIIYVATGEIYPTVVRVTALGLGSSLARAGGAVAPFIALTVSTCRSISIGLQIDYRSYMEVRDI